MQSGLFLALWGIMDLRALNLNSGPDWGHCYLLAKESLQCLLATCLSVFRNKFQGKQIHHFSVTWGAYIFEITERYVLSKTFPEYIPIGPDPLWWCYNTLAVLLQWCTLSLFLPLLRREGLGRHVSCVFLLTGHYFYIALQPMSSLSVCHQGTGIAEIQFDLLF